MGLYRIFSRGNPRCNFCYNIYRIGHAGKRPKPYYGVDHQRETAMGSSTMKLPLITATVVAYTVLAMAWICYAELALP